MTAPLDQLRLEESALLAALAGDLHGGLLDEWAVASAMPHHEGGTLIVVSRPDSRVTLGL